MTDVKQGIEYSTPPVISAYESLGDERDNVFRIMQHLTAQDPAYSYFAMRVKEVQKKIGQLSVSLVAQAVSALNKPKPLPEDPVEDDPDPDVEEGIVEHIAEESPGLAEELPWPYTSGLALPGERAAPAGVMCVAAIPGGYVRLGSAWKDDK